VYEREWGLLLVHLHVVQQGEQVDHAVAEEAEELKFGGGAFRVDGQVIDERLEAADGSQVLKQRPDGS
jgi:hypothetical protein